MARIFSALKYLSAIKPIMNGAMIAPHDCVENTAPVSAPLALRLFIRNVPSVTNHAPQTKNSRNIMVESWILVIFFIYEIYLPRSHPIGWEAAKKR
jgi:hypothetical protein